MIIKNRTNQVQEISVMTRDNTSLTYSLYVKAKGEIDVDDSLVILNLKSLIAKGIVSTVNSVVEVTPVEIPEVIDETTTEVVDTPEETVEEIPEIKYEFPTPEEDVPATPDEVEVSKIAEDVDKILCEVCGKEFASQRSLTLHMNKSHKE